MMTADSAQPMDASQLMAAALEHSHDGRLALCLADPRMPGIQLELSRGDTLMMMGQSEAGRERMLHNLTLMFMTMWRAGWPLINDSAALRWVLDALEEQGQIWQGRIEALAPLQVIFREREWIDLVEQTSPSFPGWFAKFLPARRERILELLRRVTDRNAATRVMRAAGLVYHGLVVDCLVHGFEGPPSRASLEPLGCDCLTFAELNPALVGAEADTNTAAEQGVWLCEHLYALRIAAS